MNANEITEEYPKERDCGEVCFQPLGEVGSVRVVIANRSSKLTKFLPLFLVIIP